MARPRTHGSPVSFRLPLDYDEQLGKRAAEHGESTAEYVRRNIIRALDLARRPRTPRNGAKKPLSRDKVTPIPKTPKAVPTHGRRKVAT